MTFNMKLPFKFAIIRNIAENPASNINTIMEKLKDDYGSEGQFNLKMVSMHLDSLRTSGLIQEDTNYCYSLTATGHLRLKYITHQK
ncbi:MAG: hypothetical protein HQK50_07600 [Oligoflexia bacterium]|nr:hypothetical protein [Oligoflexia bacterium]MBF0365420.1 hypothetical protein [Oligoflexia bacterium]